MDASQLSELDRNCLEVEMRICMVKAWAADQHLSVDIDEEYGCDTMRDDVDYLDEQAHIAIRALVEAGFLKL